MTLRFSLCGETERSFFYKCVCVGGEGEHEIRWQDVAVLQVLLVQKKSPQAMICTGTDLKYFTGISLT